MKPAIATLLVLLVAAACSAPVVQGVQDSATGASHQAPVFSAIAPSQAVVVLKAGAVLERDSFTDCVHESLTEGEKELRTLSEKAFREALFPWFEKPLDGAMITDLLARPLVRNKIDELGVRFLIEVSGQTKENIGEGLAAGGVYIGSSGVFACGAGYGGAGCLGLMGWGRKSDLSVVVWDLKEGVRAANMGVEVSGGAVMIGFILPIPLLSPTGSAVCAELGKHLRNFLVTGELPQNPPRKDSMPERQLAPPATEAMPTK